MTDPTTTDRHTCSDRKAAAGPAWECPRCSAASAASAASLPPADQAALRDRIAAALYAKDHLPGRDPKWTNALAMDREVFEGLADAVLAVLPATTDQPADRAAVLREAIDRLTFRTAQAPAPRARLHSFHDVAWVLIDELRRMADETPAAETEATVVQHAPGKAVRCPDCRSKGYAVCLDEPAEAWNVSDARPGTTDHTLTQQPTAGARQDGAQPLPTPTETAAADESPHVYMDAVQDSAAWAHAFTKAGQMTEALEHVEAMERLLAVYRRAVGA